MTLVRDEMMEASLGQLSTAWAVRAVQALSERRVLAVTL